MERYKAGIHGFLHADGTRIVDENQDTVLLTGWGLGNWLLPEGYMWKAYNSPRFDRPRRIEAVIRELTGSEFAEQFFRTFRETYITREDILAMAEAGYNSLRIPMNARLFLEEEPGIRFKEEGFALLDTCLAWCEEAGIYAFLDLHGAPGGQTGANIDDCVDDVPRLFTDKEQYEKGVALWAELARRYHNREVVGGYDLLNEPIRPEGYGGGKSYEYLLPRLIAFYEDCIREIRKVDTNHLISIEGHHWATDTRVFCKKFDDNMAIHFHRYACYPEKKSFEEFLALSKQYQVPLWLGETGENHLEWYAAMFELSAELGCGYTLWPWKKMDCQNSPCSVKEPKDWKLILEYAAGGAHPGYKKAQEILSEYLTNIRYENCVRNHEVEAAVFRTKGVKLLAVDYDAFPGKGISFSGSRLNVPMKKKDGYRTEDGMCILEAKELKKRFAFDCMHDRFCLELEVGEFACYTLYPKGKERLTVCFYGRSAGVVALYADGELLLEQAFEPGRTVLHTALLQTGRTTYRLYMRQGIAEFEYLKME